MAFNIWERWPWTSFQNLNLDWLMKAVKEAVTKADNASETVGQFDQRITTAENNIEWLRINLDATSTPARVVINSALEARYKGSLITGAELKAMLQTHGDLPFVEYNREIYTLDSVSNAGDLRFSMGHTSGAMDDDLVIRHIMIPAQSSNCAYSISNIGGGGGSSGNVFAVVVRAQSGGYVSDHTYSEILTQMQNGRIPVLLVVQGANYESCPMARIGSTTSGGQTVDYVEFSDTVWMVSESNVIGSWRIYSNGTVSRVAPFNHLATLDNIVDMVNDGVSTNALLKTAQTLSTAEQAQVKQNLGITSGESSGMTQIPITLSGGVYSTTMTAADLLDHLHTNGCFAVVNGVYYVPVGAILSGPYGNVYLQSVDQSNTTKTDVSVLRLYMDNDSSPSVTVTLYEKDIPLISAPPIVDTATGDPASITDGADEYPIRSLIATINPVQSGSGDPSPTNIRPITGWNAIEITKTTSSGSNSYTVAIPSAAGIVYGGTLDVVTGLLTVERKTIDLDSITWSKRSSAASGKTYFQSAAEIADMKTSTGNATVQPLISSHYKAATWANAIDQTGYDGSIAEGWSGKSYIAIYDSSKESLSAEEFQTAMSGVQLCYVLATPIVYQVTPLNLKTALGENDFSADSGAVAVEYYADTKLYVDRMVGSIGNRTTGTALASTIKETKYLEETEEPVAKEDPEDEESDDN